MPEEQPLFTGPCCVCREEKEMRSVGMLPFRGPTPGKGWACLQCGLPSDGAIVVVCDDCYELEGEPVLACADSPKSPDRVEVSSLTIPFEHDIAKHPEMVEPDGIGDFEGALEGAECMKRALLICDGKVTAAIVDGIVFDDLPMLRVVVLLGNLPIAEFAVPTSVLPEGAGIGDEMSIEFQIRSCRKCGCTGARACVTGCEWIEQDLCSNCGVVILDAAGRPATGGV